MTKQAMGLFLLSVLAAAGGCNVCRAIVYDPFGPNTLCDARRGGLRHGCEPCGTECDEPCGPVLRGRCGPRGAVVEPCDDGMCGECGEPACHCRCRRLIRGPLSLIFGLFGGGCYRGYDGCGERYWGDWYGDPPECSDPCDHHGNFTGGGCSSCGGGGVMPGMSGPMEEAPMPGHAGGCRSCGQGGISQSFGQPGHPTQYAGSPRSHGYSPVAAGPQRYPSKYASARGQRVSAPNSPTPEGSGPYAPRLISTTDRVVKPATPDQGPRLAQPQRADVFQE